MKLLYLAQGQPLSRCSAEIAITITKSCDAQIKGLFVIDPQEILKLEGFAGPGLCGSGVFIQAEQEIISAMTDLGESLLMSFRALAEGQGIQIETVIEVGRAQQEIARHLMNADAIVLAGIRENMPLVKELRQFDIPIVVVMSHYQCILLQPFNQASSLAIAMKQGGIKVSAGECVLNNLEFSDESFFHQASA